MPPATHTSQRSVINWINDHYALPEAQRPSSPSAEDDSRADSPVLGDTEGKPVYVDIIVDLEARSTHKDYTPSSFPTKKMPKRPTTPSSSGSRDYIDKHPPPLPSNPAPQLPRMANINQYSRKYLPSQDSDPTLFYNNIPSRVPRKQIVASRPSLSHSRSMGFVGTPEVPIRRYAPFPPAPPPPPSSLYTNRHIRAAPAPSVYSEDSIEEAFPLPPPLRRPIPSHRSNSTTSTTNSVRTPSLMSPSSEYSSFSETESEFDFQDHYVHPPSVRNNSRVRLGVRTFDYDTPAFEFAHIVEGAGEWRWHPYDDERAHHPPLQPPNWNKPRWRVNVDYEESSRMEPSLHPSDHTPIQYRGHTRHRAISERSHNSSRSGRSTDDHYHRARGPYLSPPGPPPAVPLPTPPKPQTKRGKFMNFVMTRIAWRPSASPKKAASLPPPSLRSRSQVSLEPPPSVAPPLPPLPSRVHGRYYNPEPFGEELEYHNHLRPVESHSSLAASTEGSQHGKPKPNVMSLKSLFFS